LDPSHIAGRRDAIFNLCQTALDLNYDGFIIETHNDPDNAWSDAAQQITPEYMAKIVSRLTRRVKAGNNIEFQDSLNNL